MKKISFALLLAFISTVTIAQTIRYVKPGGTGDGSSWANASGSLQVMINASAANDEVWVAAGTYKPALRADNGSAANAADRDNAFVLKTDVNLYGGFAGAETQLTQRNWAANPTILSGDFADNDMYDADGKLTANGEENAIHVVISAGDAGTARIDGFTILGGYARGGSGSVMIVNGQRILSRINGGGMLNIVSSPGIFNCSFKGNTSSYGGGMYNNSSSSHISNCSFNGNVASEGGGMYNISSSPGISNCSFSKNTASMGGGVYNDNSFAEISNCSFIKNKAHSIGGGIYNNNNSSPGIFNCVISENTADYAGGLYISYGNVTHHIVNCCILGNSATYLGGGIYTETLDICYIVNCSITTNTSGRGGGIYSTNGLVNVQNTIIWGNNSGIDGYNTFRHCLIQGQPGATDPLFTNAVAGDCSLQAGSPAINTGNNTMYEAADGNTGNNSLTTDTDVAGNTRLIDAFIDMGAYEFREPQPDANGIMYVTQGGTGNFTGNSWANAIPDLQVAINTAGVTQVWVAAGTYKPAHRADNGSAANATDRDNAFVLKTDVKLYGGFAGAETQLTQRNWATNPTILSGDLAGNDTYDGTGKLTANGSENAYHVVIAAGNAGTARLDGFIIRGANANGGSHIIINGENVSRLWGGGMNNTTSSPFIANCTFSGNEAGFGGGLVNFTDASPRIVNCCFKGNNANRGGGIFNFTAGYGYIVNCTFMGNTAGRGGGIATGGGWLNVQNTIIWGNSPDGIDGSNFAPFYNCLIEGRTGGSNGNIDGSTDPLFTNIAAGDCSLKAGSPAINTGSNGIYETADANPNNNSLTSDSDLAGNARVIDGVIDMGAYERPLKQQTITATSPLIKIYGDADFSPATASSSLPVAYTSSNTAVASVTGNNIHINGVGTTTITAAQNGNSVYDPATAASIALTVNPKDLIVTANSISKVYGDADPVLTYTVTGLVGTDALTGTPDRAPGENTSTYIINQGSLSGGNNYTIHYTGNNFIITKAILTAMADDKAMCFGTSLPAFTIQYNGFKNGDNQSAIAVIPAVSLAQPAVAGPYPITPAGGSAANYTFSYANGTLTVHPQPPTPAVTVSGNQTIICAGDLTTLTATATGVAGYTWSTGTAGASITTGRAGNYTVQSVSNQGCLSPVSSPVVITVSPLPTGNITQTATGAGVVAGYTLQAPAGLYYNWNTGEASPSIVVRTPGTYTVKVTSADGCSNQFSTQVNISTISVPNTFSPNGDGINEYWTIPALANSGSVYVLITNRDGQTVFESRHFTRWDGTYHGNALPAGVYYYRLRTAPGAQPQTGWLNLVR